MRASKILGLALAVGVASLLAATPVLANCSGGGSIFQGFIGNGFSNCGDNATSFVWTHQRAVQGVISGLGTNGPSGVDSGANSTIADGVMIAGSNAGEYFSFPFDWSLPGTDGCTTLALETDISCANGTQTLPVNDWAIAGQFSTNHLLTMAAAVSVDGNEPLQAWILDQAGAISDDGNACGNDANTFNLNPITCTQIPAPTMGAGTTCDATGCILKVTIPSYAPVIMDDCAVAASKAIDCPRNLYVGRQIFAKRAACNATAPGVVGTFDTRTWAMDPTVFPGTTTANFFPFSPQDLNVNGIQDAGESTFTFLRVAGAAASAPLDVKIPKIAGASDCIYLGIGIVYDSAPIAPGVNVFSPRVSVNPVPISANSGTPAADKVFNLVASKSSGKANVAWDTSAELTTSGFNLIGTKKNGGSIQMNSSLIHATEGTTGGSASYSIDLSSGDLKGSTAVYVELVKTNGAKERFGPVSF